MHHFLTSIRPLAVAIAIAGTASASQAATTVYTDRAAFDLATGGALSFEDFSGGTTSPAGFSVSGNGVFVTGTGELRGRPTIFGSAMTYTFASPITAFGGDFDTSPGEAASACALHWLVAKSSRKTCWHLMMRSGDLWQIRRSHP